MVEVAEPLVTIGRDPSNTVCLQSPLVSRHHAVVRGVDGRLQLENIGLNSCLVGDEEVLGGQTAVFVPGTKVRIWPFSLTFEAEKEAAVSRGDLEAHLRAIMADLELRIHRKLLERLDLYEFEANRGSDPQSILLLENNIEDVCREMGVFGADNEPLLEEITGLTLRDHLVNQLIMETGGEEYFDLAALTSNEFDVPATLVPEREAELHGLLQFVRERLNLAECRDTSQQVTRVEGRFNDIFHLVRPHLHQELRKYLILRTLKKDLKDTIFGFGPLQDLLRAPTVTEIMVVGVRPDLRRARRAHRALRAALHLRQGNGGDHRADRRPGGPADRQEPAAGGCPAPRRFPRQRHHSPPGGQRPDLDGAEVSRPAADDGRPGRDGQRQQGGGDVFAGVRHRPPQHPRQRRHRHRQDDHAQRAEQLHSLQGTHHHHRGHHRVAAAPGARGHAGDQAAQHRGGGRVHHPRPGANALRMRPDRVLVGECRGPEALDMIQAMNTGHDGSMTTVHANSAREVIERLEVLVLMAADLPVSSIHRQVSSALDLIVHISRLPGGARVITQVSEVVRYDAEEDEIVVTDIFNYRDGVVLRPTGYLPSFIDSLMEKELLDLEFLYGREPDGTGK